MRIISGFLKGRKIHPPKQVKARPTTDLAREALFSYLINKFGTLENKVVYDLFAGSGTMSFEFISRGAEQVYAAEIDLATVRFIGNTAREFEVNNLKVIKADVWKLIKALKVEADIIFADPPFTLKEYPKLVSQIMLKNILKPGGILVIEHPDEIDLSSENHFVETKAYGRVHFSFFEAT